MKRFKIILLALIMLLNSVLLTGCWNYREVDQFSILAGIAIDKGEDNTVVLTAEIAKISGGKDTTMTSEIIVMKGKSILDAARNEISLAGRRLYWSHATVIIISKELAQEGIIKVLDWFIRDSETRSDIHILVSKGESAKEIFEGKPTSENVISFELDKMMENQSSISKFPNIDIWEIANVIKSKGISCIVPSITLLEEDKGKVPHIMGTAIFKGDKLVGFLNGEETRYMLFAQDQIKKGVLPIGKDTVDVPVTLEIFRNKTNVKTVVNGENIEININIETTAAIDEIDGSKDYMQEDKLEKLEKSTSEMLNKSIEGLIKKVQQEYGVDIFGFGERLSKQNVSAWNSVKDNWDEKFKDVTINIKSKVNIKNSAALSKPLEVGE